MTGPRKFMRFAFEGNLPRTIVTKQAKFKPTYIPKVALCLTLWFGFSSVTNWTQE